MSQENVEVVRGVRTRVTVSTEDRRRTLDERILVRFPALVRLLASVWSRLPPRSRLRRAWTSRFVRQAVEAANRRDFELLLLLIDPEVEYEPFMAVGSDMVFPDLTGVQRGHAGYVHVWKQADDAYADLKLAPEELIDFGDRIVTAGRTSGRGRHTGIALDQPLFQVLTLRHGLLIRQKDFTDRDQALEAAGLRE
jgi:ketosteroid isomerase-like protein